MSDEPEYREGTHSAHNLYRRVPGLPRGRQIGSLFDPLDTPVVAAAMNFALRPCDQGGMVHLPDPSIPYRCARCPLDLRTFESGDIYVTEPVDWYPGTPALGGKVGYLVNGTRKREETQP